MFSEPVLDAIAFHGTENSAACFRAIPDLTFFCQTPIFTFDSENECVLSETNDVHEKNNNYITKEIMSCQKTINA